MKKKGPKGEELSKGFDAVYKGMEISSGGQRIHIPELLIERFKAKGMKVENFKDYIDSFRYGSPMHAGWGIGVERMTMLILGLPNITGNYVVYATQITNTEFSDKPAGTFSITLADIKEAIGVSGLFYLMMFTVMGALIGMSIFQNSTATIAAIMIIAASAAARSCGSVGAVASP